MPTEALAQGGILPPLQTCYNTFSSEAPQMTKVYAVIGGIDYEGENFRSLRLFDCFSTATNYMRHLEEVEGFDYAIMEVREVCMESALATA
jgi:hypothetical protein